MESLGDGDRSRSQEMSITGPVPSASRVSATTKRDFFSNLPNELLDLIFSHIGYYKCPTPLSKRLQSFSEKACYNHIDLQTATHAFGLLELLEGARGSYFAGLIRAAELILDTEEITAQVKGGGGDAGNAVEAILSRLDNLTTLHSSTPEMTLLLFAYPVCTHHSAHITTLTLDTFPDHYLPMIFAIFPQVTDRVLSFSPEVTPSPANLRVHRNWNATRCRDLGSLQLYHIYISPAVTQFIGSIRTRRVHLSTETGWASPVELLSQVNDDIVSLDLILGQRAAPTAPRPYSVPGLFSRFQQMKELILDSTWVPLHPEFWSKLLQQNTSLETIKLSSSVKVDLLPLIRILRSQAPIPPLKHVYIGVTGTILSLDLRRGNILELVRLGKLRGIVMKGSMFAWAIEDQRKEEESWNNL